MLLGCSGAASSELFGSPSSTIEGDDAATHDPARVDASGDAFSPPDDVTAPIDSALPPADVSVADTQAPVDNPGIHCGATYCDPKGSECCRFWSAFGATANDTFVCLPQGTCPVLNTLAIHCDDAADCDAAGRSGEVCCMTENAQTGRAETVECTAVQDCASNVQTNMCDTNLVDACPNGGTCKASQTTIPGYDMCF